METRATKKKLTPRPGQFEITTGGQVAEKRTDSLTSPTYLPPGGDILHCGTNTG